MEDTYRRREGRRRGGFCPPFSAFSHVSGSGCIFFGKAHNTSPAFVSPDLGLVAASHCCQSLGDSLSPRCPFRFSTTSSQSPAPNSWHGCCLPIWTQLLQWPFCYLNGLCRLLFLLPLQRSKMPLHFSPRHSPFLRPGPPRAASASDSSRGISLQCKQRS